MWEKTHRVKIYVVWLLVQCEHVGMACGEELDALLFDFS